MDNILANLDPKIQTTIQYLSSPSVSLSDIAAELGISKQAVHKRVTVGIEYLKAFNAPSVPSNKLQELEKEIERLKGLMKQLQLLLVIKSSLIILLTSFQEKVLKFYPNFKVRRYTALQKFNLLQMAVKFKRLGGSLKDFAQGIGKSPETIASWQKRYNEKGINGLHDKTTRPKNFGNKIPLKIKRYLLALFLRFPKWTDYQYHKYLRSNLENPYYLSLPTIQKIRKMSEIKSTMEKERIRKRWCFAKGTDAWTIDFTCIFKTENYKLQLLTVSDARSRFLFKTALLLNTSTEFVVDHLIDLFHKYGKPTIIKADNGAEFRVDCEAQLRKLSVYLLSNPPYYGQFNGAHERIHRSLKVHIDDFSGHHNLTRLVEDIKSFEDEYNYQQKKDYLEDRTPADVYFNDKDFVPQDCEVISPYEKDGEFRIKFKNRDNLPARRSIPKIDTEALSPPETQ